MLGIVGIGFMGMTHFTAARASKQLEVAAIATSSKKKQAGDWSEIQGNFGPRGDKKTDLSGVKVHSKWQDLIADENVSIVDVCTPVESHVEIAMAAIKAGKHVIIEKPITVDLKEADKLVKAADKAGVRLFVAQVLPFFPEFTWLRKTISEHRYGKVMAAHFKRVICPPPWLDAKDFPKMGGWGIDLHIHDNHLITLLFGKPEKVSSVGKLNGEYLDHVATQYDFGFPSAPTVSCVSGGIAAGGLKFHHGFEVFFEKATVQFDAGTYGKDWIVNRPVTLIDKTDRIRTPKIHGGSEWYSAFLNELELIAKAVRTNQPCPELDGQIARDALAICHAEAKSVAGGKPTKVS